ncbi:MAG: tRNA epoxyqueuosine(34) reductase QueG [Planctomycetota bacterium]
MRTHAHSQDVKQAAASLGFDRCGIALAGPSPRADYFSDWLASGRAGSMAYMHRHGESRRDVRAWLPWARSVIVVALNYSQPEPVARHPTTASPTDRPASRHRGRIAMYAWGEDYHLVVREKLDALVARMHTLFDEPFEAKVCVDTSAIIERELAAAAGIGWIGKNTLVLHPALGSLFFLGEIVTDLSLAPDEPVPDRCGTCTACLEACPTRALVEPYRMDASRCIAYLTIEHRGDIPPGTADGTGDWIFGCDVCQTVCPHNRDAPPATEPRFLCNDVDAARPPLDAILSWDADACRRFTDGKASRRAKLEMWQRNARIAQRNARPGCSSFGG